MSRFLLDCETNGLLHELDVVHCLVLKNVETGEVLSCADQPGYPSIDRALDYISEATQIIGHSVINFDMRALSKVYPSLELRYDCDIYDTLNMSRLLWPELEPVDRANFSHIAPKYIGSHSLAAWGERLGVAKIKFKEEEKKKEVENVWAHWSDSMQTYCVGDVEVTDRLYNYLQTQEADPRSVELEHEFAKVMARQESFGFPFNERAAYALVNTLKARRDEIHDQLTEVFPPITEERISAKTGRRLQDRVTIFNPASRQQTAERLQNRYPEISFGATDKGNVKLDDDVLEVLGEKYPEAKLLAEYQLLNKRLGQVAEGRESWLKHCQLYKDSRIHGSVKTNGCVSGRCTHCIEENQRVTTPEGLIPIKDIKVGQYVYSYDGNFNLQLNPVKEVIRQGIQECYKITWRTNSGKSKVGSIVCTENHKFYTRSRGMIRAKDLRIGEKITHLSISVSDGRKVLHMVNRKTKRQCTFIKENLYGKSGRDWHLHHVDFNKLNDSIDNLQLVTATEHAKIHFTGENNPGFLKTSKFRLLRMLAKAKARPTYIEMDFDTLKKKCKDADISIPAVVARYSKVTGKYITKRMVHKMLDEGWSPYRAGKEFCITWNRARIDRLLESHGIVNNHWIASIEKIGSRETYDLSVHRHHNFICEELCVSNSSPNMSQVPAVGAMYGDECRALFTAPEGWKLVGTDAAALELRALGAWLAHFDGGEYARLVSTEGFDIHSYNAQLFGIWDGKGEIQKSQRNLSKSCIFAVCYGAGARKVGSLFYPSSSEHKMMEKGKEVIDTFYKRLPAIKKMKDKIGERVSTRGYLVGIDGRRLQIRSAHSALNQLLQSTGAILMKKATCILYNDLKNQGVIHDRDYGFCGFFHDEWQIAVKPEYAEKLQEISIKAIEKSGQYFNLLCPFTGESRVGQNWMETH